VGSKKQGQGGSGISSLFDDAALDSDDNDVCCGVGLGGSESEEEERPSYSAPAHMNRRW
jgi:hypothetical protein